jgi:tight adherence protein B
MLISIVVLIFVSVVLIVQTVASVMFRSRDQHEKVNRRLTMLASGVAADEVFTTLMRKAPTDALAIAAPGFYERAELYLRQAGLMISPTRLAGMIAGIALVMWLVATIFLSLKTREDPIINAVVAFVGAIGLTLVGASVWLTGRRQKRLRQIEEQLPLALDISVRSLRAGHPVVVSIRLASQEMRDPIGSELGLVVDETTYGAELRDALVNLARRTGSPYLHFFAITISIQAETGGNLAEILNSLNVTIRAQQNLHLRVRALASEGRMSALVLSVIPAGLVSFIMLTQPTFYTTRANDPIFWPAVGATAGVYLLGQYCIHRIVNFKY